MSLINKNTVRIIRTQPTHIVVHDSFLMTVTLFFTRFIFRLMSIPIYALVAAPWIFVTFIDYSGDGALQRFIAKSIAWLSGNPSATSLDESDLGIAVLTLFIILDILIELFNLIVRKKKTIGISNEQQLKIMLAITALGWIVFAIKFFEEFGIHGVSFAIAFGIISSFFINIIHSIKNN